METLRPQKQQQKYRGGGGSNQGAQYVDLQSIDFQHLQNIDFKYLQDLLHQAKEISLPNLNLPIGNTKNLEIVEVSLDSLRQGSQKYGGRSNNGFGGYRNAQRNNKGGYRKSPQGRAPSRSPVQYEYISFAKNNPILPQTLPKHLEITPIQLPHSVPSIDELLKNIQVADVPAHIPYEINNNKGGAKANTDKGGLRFNNQQQYRVPSQKSQQNSYAQASYFAHQTEQPRKHHAPPQQKANNIQLQPDIEAELIKLSQHELKHLLSNLQVLDKSPHDLLKHLPFGNVGNSKNENVQLILSLPEAGFNEGENSPVRSFNTHKSHHNTIYGNEGQFGGIIPQSTPYQPKEVNSYSVNTGGYQIANHENYEQHEAGGYEAQDQAPRTHSVHYEQSNYQSVEANQGYDQQKDYHQNGEDQQGYEQQKDYHQNVEAQGYGQQKEYHQNVEAQQGYGQQNDYHQNVEEQQGYDQQKGYQKDNEEPQSGYEGNGNEQYSKASPESTKEQQGSYGQREQSYIQVISPQTDENGYRREPVLAVEIQHGQTIEDAIKSLDPETLKKLGTHGENGIEIEVVEVPVDEYASESKKTETVVSAKNSTLEVKSNSTVTKS